MNKEYHPADILTKVSYRDWSNHRCDSDSEFAHCAVISFRKKVSENRFQTVEIELHRAGGTLKALQLNVEKTIQLVRVAYNHGLEAHGKSTPK